MLVGGAFALGWRVVVSSLPVVFIVGCSVGFKQAGKTCPDIVGISCR